MDMQTISLAVLATVYVVDLVVRLWLLGYIPKNRKPTAAMSWLLLIYIVPVVGTIVFFLIGNTKLSTKRQHDQRRITRLFADETARLRSAGLVGTPTTHPQTAQLAEHLTGLAPTTGNTATLLNDYDQTIAHITRAIDRAVRCVYVEFYVLALDQATEPFFAAMERAVSRGVDVKVLFDAYGSRKYPKRRAMLRRLTAAGIEWHAILPLQFRLGQYNRPDLRNHRKIVVIDDRDAYTGSLNMIDKTYHRKDDISYLELMIHVRGTSASQLAAVFASDWYLETGQLLQQGTSNVQPARGDAVVQVVPSGPAYLYQNNHKVFTSLIYAAERSVVITNPYLVPDESLLRALISAAQRGVEVSVLNSEAMDQWMVGHAQRSYYEELLRAGVQIHLYKKPQLVHEKFIVVDQQTAVVGSSNMDVRSFELNLECVVVLYDAALASELHTHHEALREHAQHLTVAAWLKRPLRKSFVEPSQISEKLREVARTGDLSEFFTNLATLYEKSRTHFQRNGG